jgi:N-acetylmuramoyl-L-alanine amidase
MHHRKLFVIIFYKKFFYTLVFFTCLLFGFCIWNQPAIRTSIPLSTLVSGRKVVIDAGHGGADPGAKSACGLSEKELNLDVALKLKKYLSRVGVYCIMIRETDRDFFDNASGGSYLSKKQRDLIHRINLANQSKADLFLSIHANSFPQVIYRGAQTFYNKKNSESKRLAEAVQRFMVEKLGPNKRRPKTGDFRVLNETQMPGVTIEIGFLSNLEETKLLKKAAYREKIAEAIYHGVVYYFTHKS